MRLKTEMKMLQAKIQAAIVQEETVGNTSRFSDANAKHPNFPHFQDGKDDLDIWLTRFERFAESNNWSRDKWSSLLCALLTGRALDCYGRLSTEQAQDYDKVKQALMKRYDLTDDGYRRKFRSYKPAEGESPHMFIVRIVTYLDRWIELSRTEKSYEKLKDLIVQEQFMDACPENLATSLREKDLSTLERIAKEADLFLQARHRKLCDQPCRTIASIKKDIDEDPFIFVREFSDINGLSYGTVHTTITEHLRMKKGRLAGWKFNRVQDLAKAVNSELRTIPEEDYQGVFRKWQIRLTRCL
ncbi:reverse transcriptase [Elysia marginata]|uniref:Reverse transcriptase n=1 Tax=Elysia marginata TaxID=1093978 RepID=A0AAV4IMT6_9GAST|nr:reverse transcriptase [Elysia marginata]